MEADSTQELVALTASAGFSAEGDRDRQVWQGEDEDHVRGSPLALGLVAAPGPTALVAHEA
uniref:Uncharacterized protein n=1 Tax=Leersia perrieri TaxID=77586 RepID=A0A0D9VZM9_9ORYZ